MTINSSIRLLGRWGALLGFLVGGLLLAGCQSSGPSGNFADQQAGGVVPADSAVATTPAGAGSASASTNAGPDYLRPGDSLTIVFSDLPEVPLPVTQRVKEDGTITLMENQSFVAAGKTRGDLEKEIRERYVPKYYLKLTVNIKPEDRFYFVGGEVKSPGRQIYLGPVTVIKAIQSCGDFTDFANKKKVKLIRVDGKTYTVNCVKAIDKPDLDLPVYPGDKIHVPRRLF